MPTIHVAVVRRATEKAVQLVFWNELKGWHEIQWAPRSMVKTKCNAGDRDIEVEVVSALGQLSGWEFLVENERAEHLARMDSEW